MYIEREKITRNIYRDTEFNPILILIGARQVGKTTILKNLKLSKPSLYIIGQDPDIGMVFEKYSTAESYLKINLNPELNGYLLLDEFQFISNISTTLKLLTDKNPELKVICSGSSSLDIIQQVEESLAGRVHVIDIYSLSFAEYLKFQDEEIYNLFLRYDGSTVDEIVAPNVKISFQDYLVYGGMPRVALAKDPEIKIQLLDDIYKTYLLRDVRNYVKNEDSVGFNKLLTLLATQIGGMVNVNELSNSSGLSYRKCEDYLFLLEQMFIIQLIEPYFTNKRKVITKMKKVYFTDIGLRNAVIGNFTPIGNRVDKGAIFENYVYLELKRKLPTYAKIFFYRTKDGSEVDFIIDNMKNKYAVEAKYKSIKKAVNFKNLTGLKSIENFKKIFIVNENYNIQKEDTQYIQGYLADKMELS